MRAVVRIFLNEDSILLPKLAHLGESISVVPWVRHKFVAGRLRRLYARGRAALLASCRVWAGYTKQVGPRSPRLSPKPDIGNHDPGAGQVCLCAIDDGAQMPHRMDDLATQLCINLPGVHGGHAHCSLVYSLDTFLHWLLVPLL